MDYHKKYLKYKTKYLLLREQIGGKEGIRKSKQFWLTINKAKYNHTFARSDIEFITGTNEYTPFWKKLSELQKLSDIQLQLEKETIYSFDPKLLNHITTSTTSKPFIHVFKESDDKWKFYLDDTINIWITESIKNQEYRLNILNDTKLYPINYDTFMKTVRENGQVMCIIEPNSKISVKCGQECKNNIRNIIHETVTKENAIRTTYIKQRSNCIQTFILYDKKKLKKYLKDKFSVFEMVFEMYYIKDQSIIHNDDLIPYCRIHFRY
jgi:hypothetical protein